MTQSGTAGSGRGPGGPVDPAIVPLVDGTGQSNPDHAPDPPPVDTTGRGIAFIVLAVLTGSVMDALIKYASPQFHTTQIVFFRAAISLIPVAILVWRSGGVRVLATRHPRRHAVRVAWGMIAMFGFFYALGAAPLAQVIAIGFAAPLIMTALGALVLGEVVRARRWTAVIVGFGGVVVILDPAALIAGGADFNLGLVAALAGAIGYAASSIMVRSLSATDTALAIMFYYLASMAAVSGVAMPFFWNWGSTWTDWIPLVLIGAIGWFVQLGMTQAFRYAEASAVAPFEYLAIVFAVGLGYAVWGEIPDITTYLGSAVIIAAGLYILHRETRLGAGERRD